MNFNFPERTHFKIPLSTFLQHGTLFQCLISIYLLKFIYGMLSWYMLEVQQGLHARQGRTSDQKEWSGPSIGEDHKLKNSRRYQARYKIFF
jgi:hypothetical protein